MQSSLSYGLNNTSHYTVAPFQRRTIAPAPLASVAIWGRLAPSSADYTLAGTTWASGQRKQGGSVRFLYAKSFLWQKTDFQIAGYRYSTAGYYSLSDAVNERRRWHNGLYENDYWPSNEAKAGRQALPNTITRPGFIIKSIALIFLPGKLSVRTALSSLTSASKITGIAQEAISRCRRALTALSIT